MITGKNILDLVKQYVETNDLETFAHSFAPTFYDIEETGDTDAIQMAYEVESMFAAMTAGVCSEAEFQAAMKSLSPSLSIVVSEPKLEGQSIIFLTKAAGAAGAGMVTFAYVDTAPSVGFGSATDLPSTHQTNISLPQWQQVLEA